MKLYSHNNNNDYTLINHQNIMYELIHLGNNKYMPKKIGKVSDDYVISGKLLKNIPNYLKRLCFNLNKKI